MNISYYLNYLFGAVALFIVIKSLTNPLISKYKNRNDSTKVLRGKRFGLHIVEKIRLLTFIKLFANSLSIVFLPQYMLQITIASNIPQSFASLLYACYQIIFILMIIPGGYIVEARRLKLLLLIIIGFEAFMFFSFGIATNFWEILLLQIAFGILVPISSSTEYAYIFRFSGDKTRGEAVALYANTVRGAIIAGTFCGGWLVTHTGMQKVFFIACGLNILAMIYAAIFIPAIKPKQNILIKHIDAKHFDLKYVLTKLPSILCNINFLKMILFVGIPLGLLEEGVVLFGFPLLLMKHNFSHEITGQLLSLFAIDFFIANKYISKIANKNNAENLFLFLGLCGITISLIFISGLDYFNQGIIFVAVGLLSLGVFRGFIVSPAITYITRNSVTKIAGKNVTLSVYKVAETIGKIIGPILIMQLFLFTNYKSYVYLLISLTYFIITVLFRFGFLWLRDPKPH